MSRNQNHRVTITNGLGNQLFQFAFAHYLTGIFETNISIENKPVTVDSPDVKFLLNDLNNFCSHVDFRRHHAIGHISKLERFLYKSKLAYFWENFILNNLNYNKISETDFDLFKLPIEEMSKIRFSFEGFWQDWKFVESVKISVMQDILSFLESKIDIATDHDNTLFKNLVIHVRRGDYLLPRFNGIFGVIKIESYLPIITQIKLDNPGIHITTLTDDFDLLKSENIKSDFGKIIDPRKSNPWEALKIMTQADYLITANSSLSWWGGYLCMNQGGIVYIPRPWYQGKQAPKIEKYLHPNFNTYDAIFH